MLRGSNAIWSSRARWVCAPSRADEGRPLARPRSFLEAASALEAGLQVQLVNGRDPQSVAVSPLTVELEKRLRWWDHPVSASQLSSTL